MEDEKWSDEQNEAMDDDSTMEEDTESIERLMDDQPGGDFLRTLAGSRRGSKSYQGWPELLDDKNDMHTKSAEKNIVHQSFFNTFEDDFDDDDLK